MPESGANMTAEMTAAMRGKTVERVSDESANLPGMWRDGMDNCLTIHFTDGTALCVTYDWIYEWAVGTPQPERVSPQPDPLLPPR